MEVNIGTSSHVVVNAHLLSGQDGYRSAGVHQYIYQLLDHLGKDSDDLRYTALIGGATPPPNPAIATRRSKFSTHTAIRRVIWEQTILPWILRDLQASLVHGPVFVAPVLSGCPSVVTIHDLSYIRLPGLFRRGNRLYLRLLARLSAQRARRVIAVSSFTARETTALLGVPPERIEVIYHGVRPEFAPLPGDQVQGYREHRGLPERFVLSLGTLEPRKNTLRLVEAFAQVRRDDTPLVIAGGRGWLYDELFARIEDLSIADSVHILGFVPQEELPLLYNAATVMAYPSLYEGFGLPILEAQACGTPVVCSNTSSLPEAAGDAAVFVDPRDVDSLAAGLDRLLQDQTLRDELRSLGLRHASQFDWYATARNTARLYRSVLTERGRR
ncbi:MAG: glycosyltransferase family 4 protein [Chloroflexi bacterium]|nr:glycosyltransferase family 4 protein [Chloroflexota bacterium]